jgi:hypothetical protein
MFKRIGLATSDLLLCAIGILSVIVSVRSALSPPKSVSGLDTLLTLVLVSLGLLMIAMVVERRLRLDRLNDQLKELATHLESDSKYLPDMQSVSKALRDIVQRCSENIFCIGALSSDRAYLKLIEDAVKNRDVIYYRVVDGDHIYHPMHQHLTALLRVKGVYIGYIDREKFGNMTVTDVGAVIAFPSPYVDKLTGLSLPDPSMISPYMQHVLVAYGACSPMTEQKLTELCERCRTDIRPTTPVEILNSEKQRVGRDETTQAE